MKYGDKKKSLLPLLRDDVKVKKGGIDENGEEIWLLFDPVSDRYFRIGREEYNILSRFTPGKTEEELKEELELLGYTNIQSKINTIIRFAKTNHLFYPEYGKTEKLLLAEQKTYKVSFLRKILRSWIAIRIPLVRPDKFLDLTSEVIFTIFNKWTISILFIISSWGYIRLLPMYHRIKESFIYSLSPWGLIGYVFAIICMKCIHELSHAYAAKSENLRVREFGLAFIILLPRLYTDLSDSWALNSKNAKIKIDSAGIISEVIIGGIAALYWTSATTGIFHSVCYFVFTVSIINSLVFNGNPLMRFDGYYLLSDILNIDNLQMKSFGFIKALFRKIIWGIPFPESFSTRKIKFKNFLIWTLYGIAASVYRLIVYTSIIALIYYKFTKTLGLILAGIELGVLIVIPFQRELQSAKKMLKNKFTFYLRFILFIILPVFAILFFPFSIKDSFPCMVKPIEKSILYTKTSGFIKKIFVKTNDSVQKGASILKLDNPFIKTEERDKIIERKIIEEELSQIEADSTSYSTKIIKEKQLKSINAVIENIRRKKSLLTLTSPISGKFVIYNEDIVNGKWIEQGFPFGEIYNNTGLFIYAYVTEDKLKKCCQGKEVYVYLGNNFEPFRAIIKEINSAPVRYMEPSPLQSRYGGPLIGKNKPLSHSWASLKVLYRVSLVPQKELPSFTIGRTGYVIVKTNFVLAEYIKNLMLKFLRQQTLNIPY